MADRTSIEWTEATWTPIRARRFAMRDDGSGVERVGWHCERVSEGCRNCYAESINRRLGTQLDYKPGNLFRQERVGYANGEAKLFLDEQMLLAPLRWRRPRRIFVCSMTDLFGAWVPDWMIDRVLAVMIRASHHTFQVLTKRPDRARSYFTDLAQLWRDDPALIFERFGWSAGWLPDFPIANVWLGVSAEDQRRADERVPDLLATPAAVRFVSAEPLLGPVDFSPWLGPVSIHCDHRHVIESQPIGRVSYRQDPGRAFVVPLCSECGADAKVGSAHGLDWVIVGGESGPKARPLHPAWARSIRDQCTAAGVAFLFKQWGEWVPRSELGLTGTVTGWEFTREKDGRRYGRVTTNGTGITDFEFDGAEFETRYPWAEGSLHYLANPCMLRVGKKAAGRSLDRVEHNGMPPVRAAPLLPEGRARNG